MKITVRALGAQMRNVGFVDTGFIGRTDLIVVRYSAANSGLRSKNRFRVQGNAVKVNHI
jgi:hypothetical protein